MVEAYSQLLAEGYLTARHGSGTIVAELATSNAAQSEKPAEEEKYRYDFRPGVPLILAVPGMKANGKSSDRIVEFLDVYPTLSDLGGYKVPVKFAGMSLKPLLDDPNARWSKPGAYTQVTRQANKKQIMGKSIRTERWRYTEWDEGRLGVELYDHENDPQEFTNVAQKPEMKETIEHLKQLLHNPP